MAQSIKRKDKTSGLVEKDDYKNAQKYHQHYSESIY